MAYEVTWTPDAQHELDVILTYLTDVLGQHGSASKLLDGMEELAETLSAFPRAHEYSRDPALAARGYRKAIVGRYVVLYLVDDEHREVVVTNMFGGGRDTMRLV